MQIHCSQVLLDAKFAVVTSTSFIPHILSTAQTVLECGVFRDGKVFCITLRRIVFFRLKLCTEGKFLFCRVMD
jgi:nitrogen regulatory protein PII